LWKEAKKPEGLKLFNHFVVVWLMVHPAPRISYGVIEINLFGISPLHRKKIILIHDK
jgi:hypothetical protein